MTEQKWADDIEMTIKTFLPYYFSDDNEDGFWLAKQADIDGAVKSLADYIVRRIELDKN